MCEKESFIPESESDCTRTLNTAPLTPPANPLLTKKIRIDTTADKLHKLWPKMKPVHPPAITLFHTSSFSLILSKTLCVARE